MSVNPDIQAMKKAVEKLPQTVTTALRAVAWRTSRNVKDRAREILISKIKGHNIKGHRHVEDSFIIHEEPENKQFLVAVEHPDMPNLPLWLERGTVNMEARPFLRPAADALTPQYQREMGQAAENVVARELGAER